MLEPNVQDRNVGNRGDVAKHVALVALAGVLRARTDGAVRHVETHAFRLYAPLPHPAAWAAAVEAHADTAARARYRALQAGWVAGARYRCSAGLAADVFSACDAGREGVRLALAEAHAPTREALARAVVAEDIPVDALVSDALALATLPPPPPLPLLVHVDPFDHPERYWPTVAHLLARWRRPDQDAVVLAFAYDKTGPIRWPAAPAGTVALGRHDDAPYGLAAWASPGVAEAAREALCWG